MAYTEKHSVNAEQASNILTVLYGLHRLEQTCTQALQTFHHVKLYAGELMSTTDLKELHGKSYVYDTILDLRKTKSPGYTDYFRNSLVVPE